MHKLLNLVAILAFAATGQASYATVTFNLDTVINGSTPSGAAPWMTATFLDNGANNVLLTFTNNMESGQFITDLVFNTSLFNPSSNLSQSRSDIAPPVVNSFSATVDQSQTGGASLKAGLFNIWISFANNGPDNVFNHDNGPVIYNLSGPDLTENSFNVLSLDDPGPPPSTGGWLMAAKVQGIPADLSTTSGSIGVTAVPEPEIYAMMGIGLALIGFVARRKRELQDRAAT